MFLKKWKSNPTNECFVLVWKDFFFFLIFRFFPFSFHWENGKKKKKLSQVTLTTSGHPYNFFPQIFQFSLQTEKPLWAQPTWEFTVPLSIWISPKPKKMGSSFHQVIPTRIKVFSRCKNTENGSCGCSQWAEHDPGDKRSPSSKKHCHLKLPAMPSYSHIRQFINCGSDPAFDWDVLTPLICDQCKIQVTHPTCSKQGVLGVGGKQMERDATSSPLAIFEHHSHDLKTTSLFLQSGTTSAGTIQYWIVALQAQ